MLLAWFYLLYKSVGYCDLDKGHTQAGITVVRPKQK